MNVMKTAHKYAKHLVKMAANLSYRSALKAALIRAHKEYKKMINAKDEAIAHVKKTIASIEAHMLNTSGESFFLATADGVIMTENAEKTRLSWGNYNDALRVNERDAMTYVRKYGNAIKPVHAISFMENAIHELKKILK